MKFHFYHVEIDKKFLYRVLNNIDGISLYNIKISDDIAGFYINYGDISELKYILNSLGINILKIEEKGLFTKIINFPFLRTCLFICVVFLLLIIISSNFIWEISTEGNYSHTDEQIVAFINEQNIREGILKKYIDCESLENELRKAFDDISWVCAEIKGTNLIVHIKENYVTEISKMEDNPYNLVADRDGTIVSVITRMGKAEVKAGDTVKKGDILISGMVDVYDEWDEKLFTTFCNADGDVFGETMYEYKDSIDISYVEKEVEKERNFYIPSISNYRWMNIIKSSKNTDIIYDEKKFKLFGNFYLPVLIGKYKVIYYETKEKEYTKKQARQILKKNLLYKLANMEQKGYKILEKDVKIYRENGSYILSGTITCRQPMGVVSYIDTEQYSNQSNEETENLNEYH